MKSEASAIWLVWSNHESSTPIFIISISLVILTCYYFVLLRSRNKNPPLPPGPRGLPIVGYLPFLDPDLHTCFAKLANKYGPIFKLQLGSGLCIVLSSSSLVEEVHKFHDVLFSNRDVPAVAHAVTYGGLDVVWSPYGENWRMLRKICVRDLLSYGRLESLYGLRRRVVRQMVSKMYAKPGEHIDIAETILITLFHLLTSMLWGGTLQEKDMDRISLEFAKISKEIAKLVGLPNVSDLFPALAMFDFQGLECKIKKIGVWLDDILDFVIDHHPKITSGTEPKDFLQVLLQYKDQGDHKSPFTMNHIKGLLLDMLLPATKTSSTTVEWVMAEVMKRPQILGKVQEEINQVVGTDKIVEESHLPQLKYLNAVLKETMRLHPPAPLLVPRMPSESCTIGGYMVPQGTKILVNAWAIQRDADYWESPLEFKPERFLNSENSYDFNGSNYNFIPFAMEEECALEFQWWRGWYPTC